jgi:hypothetical protein
MHQIYTKHLNLNFSLDFEKKTANGFVDHEMLTVNDTN